MYQCMLRLVFLFFRKKRQAEQIESESCVLTGDCSPMNKLPHLDSISASPKETVVESQNTGELQVLRIYYMIQYWYRKTHMKHPLT